MPSNNQQIFRLDSPNTAPSTNNINDKEVESGGVSATNFIKKLPKTKTNMNTSSTLDFINKDVSLA
jgi:hypothetical protein